MSKLKRNSKRRRKNAKPPLEPLEAIEYLSQACAQAPKGVLQGVMQDASVWIEVDTTLAECLNNVCIGRVMHCKDEVLGRLNGEGSAVPTQSVCTIRLSLEEAFFLHYCLRCLHIFMAEEHECTQFSTQDFWSKCVGMNSNFVQSYVAYQHFRSKGWIVRSGIYYGCSYVLYSHHPRNSHAAHCVLTMNRDDELSWVDIQSLVRVCVGVKKELIILFVSIGKNLDVTDIHNLPLIEVDAVKITRWTPEGTMV